MTLKNRLRVATTQEGRWVIFKDSPAGSIIREEALKAFLDNATTRKERSMVYDNAPSGSEVEKAALRTLYS